MPLLLLLVLVLLFVVCVVCCDVVDAVVDVADAVVAPGFNDIVAIAVVDDNVAGSDGGCGVNVVVVVVFTGCLYMWWCC